MLNIDIKLQQAVTNSISRRRLSEVFLGAFLALGMNTEAAHALGFKKELKKRKVPIEDYLELRKLCIYLFCRCVLN